MQSLLWYDLETFGRHPGWDRIAQFAAVRTDDNFEPIEDPVVLYCRISPDYLPDPQACLITGITPRETGEKGMVEAEFAKALEQELSRPGTCVVGYNSLRFDDEFIRNLFYRNFTDPYRREYAQGNSRWDIIDLVRMTHDLRPEGINWVYDEEGKPVFRLEILTQANGISHEQAHDALSDVYATISLAKLIKEKQPKLFQFYFSLRKKDQVRRLLNLQNPQPLVHTSGMFTRPGGCTTVIAPITADPENNNLIHCYDLREDPEPLLTLEAGEIRRRIFTPQQELGDVPRIPVKGIYINRCPALAPLNTLEPDQAGKLGLDLQRIQQNFNRLQGHPEVMLKLRKAMVKENMPHYSDPDLLIYQGGFFGDQDKETFQKIKSLTPEELVSYRPDFEDPRGPEMYRRYLGRNYSSLLSPEEKRRWKNYCAARLLAPEWKEADNISNFKKKVEALLKSNDTSAGEKQILSDLIQYSRWLEKNLLT